MIAWYYKMKDWLPAALSVLMLICAFTYAVTKQTQAAEGIREAGKLGTTLTASAHNVESGTMTPHEIEELGVREADLNDRMRDSLRPAIVVSELSGAARKAGLLVLEIQPRRASQGGPGPQQSSAYPQYQITLLGEYQKLASFMQMFRSNRIPVRVLTFRMTRQQDQAADIAKNLRAEIVVESFVPKDALTKGTPNS